MTTFWNLLTETKINPQHLMDNYNAIVDGSKHLTALNVDGTATFAGAINVGGSTFYGNVNATIKAVGANNFGSMESSITSDGSGSYTIPKDGCIIVFSGHLGVFNAIFAATSTGTTKLIASPDASFSFGTTTNPDTSGDWNFWISAAGTLNYKNRTGIQQYFQITVLNGISLT